MNKIKKTTKDRNKKSENQRRKQEQWRHTDKNQGKRTRDKEILSFCLDEYKTATEIAELLGLKKSSYFMKQYINPLVESQYLLPYTVVTKSSMQKYIANREKLIFK